MNRLFRQPLHILLLLHFLMAAIPLAREACLVMREFPLLWGRTNEDRRIVMLGGIVDAVEDHEFMARCTRAIPPDAEVLIDTNKLADVMIINYYLYPRRARLDADAFDDGYWIVRYFTPKALGMNSIEEPGHDNASH